MLATGIPVRTWLEEDDETIATVLAIYDERARKAKQKG